MLYIYLLFLITTSITFLISGIKFSLFTVIVLALCGWRPIKKYFQIVRWRENLVLKHMALILKKKKNDSDEFTITNILGTFTFNKILDNKKEQKKNKKKCKKNKIKKYSKTK